MIRGILLLFTIVLVFSCKTDELIPVRPALIIHDIQLDLPPSENSYAIDLDSNGFVDFNLLVHEYTGDFNTKLIMRMQGVISSPFTTVIHGNLRELNSAEQCNVTYESILEPTIFQSGDSIGSNLDLKWYLIGDFHHSQLCGGGGCACADPDSDITYVPIAQGDTGYVAVRFLIRQRKHYGWLEIERSATDEMAYTITRIAYNRFFGKPAIIP